MLLIQILVIEEELVMQRYTGVFKISDSLYTYMIEMSYRNYKMQMKGKSLRWYQ